jgi:hypothetical protein
MEVYSNFRPVLTLPGYTCLPTIGELAEMDELAELKRVSLI